VPINVIVRDGVTYALNNRSLTAVRLAGVKPVLKNVTGNRFFEDQLTKRLAELAKKGIKMVDDLPAVR